MIIFPRGLIATKLGPARLRYEQWDRVGPELGLRSGRFDVLRNMFVLGRPGPPEPLNWVPEGSLAGFLGVPF